MNTAFEEHKKHLEFIKLMFTLLPSKYFHNPAKDVASLSLPAVVHWKNAVETLSRLQNSSAPHKSVRVTFTLQGSNCIKNTPEFEELAKEVDTKVSDCKDSLKADIVNIKKLEINELETALQKTVIHCSLLFGNVLVQFYRTLYLPLISHINLPIDKELNQDVIHAFLDELLNDVEFIDDKSIDTKDSALKRE